LQQAAVWYNRYYALAPDDLLGLKKLTEVCTTLEEAGVEDESCREAALRISGSTFQAKPETLNLKPETSPAAVLQEALAIRTDDRHIAAELLGVPVESIELGPSLVENGEFAEWQGGIPTGWRVGTYLGQNGDKGLYFTGNDPLLADGEAAKITTLWGGSIPDGTTTHAEYVGKNFPVADAKYLISVYYRSWGFTTGSGLIFLGDYTGPSRLVLVYASLLDSNGQWRITHSLVDGPTAPTPVVPLVRDWGVGQLWVRTFVVKRIVYEKDLHQ